MQDSIDLQDLLAKMAHEDGSGEETGQRPRGCSAHLAITERLAATDPAHAGFQRVVRSTRSSTATDCKRRRAS